jgi:exodeoxyribonuclease-3
MRLATFNVNGIRACFKKGLSQVLSDENYDIICFQETKATADQVDLSAFPQYHPYWNSAQKKGYSGTCILTRSKPLSSSYGISIPLHDQEGRVITLEYPDFFLVNVYTPNAQGELKRLPYRQQWDIDFRNYISSLDQTKPVLIAGDLNCAHQEIDLAHPKSNRENPGFSDAERAGFSAHLAAGFVDVLRHFDPRPGLYTWWTVRTGGEARIKNIGWRIDYWLSSKNLIPKIKSCRIRPDIFGSDHCPVEIELH